MANQIQILRTTTSTTPSGLAFGELAYVDGTKALYIGDNAAGVQLLNSLPTLTDVTVLTQAQGDILYATSGTAWNNLAVGAATTVLTGGTTPSWAQVNLATMVTGTLDETNGGTGQTTLTTGDLLYASASNTFSKLAVGTSSQVLHGGTTPNWAAITSTGTVTSGTWSATITSATFSGVQQLGTDCALELDPTLAATGDFSGEVITGTAGTTISIGDVCYLNASSQMVLADASAEATGAGALYVSLASLTSTQTGLFLRNGYVRATALGTGTAGAIAYLSETSGDVTATRPSTSGAIIRVVGYWYDTNTFDFRPDGAWVEV